LTSYADDINALAQVLDRVEGPAALAGHTYAGAVISEHQQKETGP